jgi:hypothetical protein
MVHLCYSQVTSEAVFDKMKTKTLQLIFILSDYEKSDTSSFT